MPNYFITYFLHLAVYHEYLLCQKYILLYILTVIFNICILLHGMVIP